MLHEFIANQHDSIAARTTEKLRSRRWPVSASKVEGGVPVFLTQLAETLRCEETAKPFSSTAIASSAARTGRDLLDLGFDVAQVVHVYGDVCQAITEMALEQNAPIGIEEFHILNRCLDTAIAEATTEHSRVAAQRTATHAVERLGKATGELRDSLHAAEAKVESLIADRRRRTQDLARLRRLSGRLLQADDCERRQMARELQENTAQILAALLTSLSLARDSDVNMDPHTRQTIAHGLSLLEKCCSDVWTMSCVLHPPLLTPFGLEPAIEAYVKSFGQRTGIEVSVDVPRGFGRLSTDRELALFRIMQEALRNVHQTGQTKAAVRAFRDARTVGLEVTGESGEGPLDGQPPEHGTSDSDIVGMGERLRSLGGRMTVSCVDNRTTVRAALPLMTPQNRTPRPERPVEKSKKLSRLNSAR
ncbi:MAG: hypothetical protein EHM13_07285, partial [Acidobacteria bacterium]